LSALSCTRAANLVIDLISQHRVAGDALNDELDAGFGEIVAGERERLSDAGCELASWSLAAIAAEQTGEMIATHSDCSSKRAEAERSFG
jgi:hypothetical protein